MVDLRRDKMGLDDLLRLAGEGAVLVVADDGREFLIAEADDFDAEVAALRGSSRFQAFLDQRLAAGPRTSIDDVERELLRSEDPS